MFKCFKKEEMEVKHLAITLHTRSDIYGDFLFMMTITTYVNEEILR